MKKMILLSIVMTLVSWRTASAQQLVECNIKASINNSDASMTTDPAGTNVRSGPGKNFSVIRTLKDELGFLFHVTASQGLWVKVNHVREIANGKESALEGWVYAPTLFLKADSDGQGGKFVPNLYASPDFKSRLLLGKNEDIDGVVALQGCQGKWAKALYKGKVGWLNPYSQCADLWDICGEK